jgi:hypothetical protein
MIWLQNPLVIIVDKLFPMTLQSFVEVGCCSSGQKLFVLLEIINALWRCYTIRYIVSDKLELE